MAIRISRTMNVYLGALALAALPLRGVAAEDVGATTTAAPAAGEQVITLNHSTANDVIKVMHWDDKAKLPDGVQSITPDRDKNTLKIIANADGLAVVKELVKDIDVPIRQIRINIQEVIASQKDIDACGVNFATPLAPGQSMGDAVQAAANHEQVMIASGKGAAEMLKTFTAKGTLLGSPTITTTNNTMGMIKITSSSGLQGLPDIQSLSLGVTPRANSDNTVTLRGKIELDPVIAGVPKDPAPPKIAEALRTVRDGETFVMVNVSHSGTGDTAKQLVIFITPHLLPLE